MVPTSRQSMQAIAPPDGRTLKAEGGIARPKTFIKSTWQKCIRLGQDLEIYVCLVGLLLIGGGMMREAEGLAANPTIIAVAKRTLLPLRSTTSEEEEHEAITHFINELGIAVVVAAVLGMTFEFFMRRREEKAHTKHVREIQEAAFASVLGFFMPSSLFRQIRRVFEEKIMRSNLELTYTFENATHQLRQLAEQAGIDGNDLLLVTVKVEYDLVNLATTRKEHFLHHGFESILPFGDEYNKFLSLTVSRGGKRWISWPGGPNERKVRKSTGPHSCIRVLELKDRIEFAPGEEVDRQLRKEDALHVMVKHQLVRRRRDLESWTTWLPADCLSVTAIFDDASDLDFHLDRTHPDDFEKVEQTSRTKREWILPFVPPGKDGVQQNIREAVLPYQGFTLYWFPQESNRRAR